MWNWVKLALIWSFVSSSFGFQTFRSHFKIKHFKHHSTKTDTMIIPPVEFARGTVKLPGSKSISNRVLLLASLSKGNTFIENILNSEDVNVMIKALTSLGISVNFDHSQCRVVGNNGPFRNPRSLPLKLDLKNAGTAMRPLVAALSFSSGKFILDGVQRMRERPILDLVDGLQQLGCEVASVDGFPPVTIDAKYVSGGEVTIKGNSSSQYLSSLLMAAPLLSEGLTVHIDGELISSPYVNITIQVMKSFGVEVSMDCNRSCNQHSFTVPAHSHYQSPLTYHVEGDASSASYFLAAGAIAGGPVTVTGLSKCSIQGDVEFANVLEMMGARVAWGEDNITVSSGTLKGIDIDCSDIPDCAMTLAVVALFAQGATTLRNIGSWRLKECDRLHAMATELKKFNNVTVEEGSDYLRVTPTDKPLNCHTSERVKDRVEVDRVKVDTYNDHRMAMCFSLTACLPHIEVVIANPGCTSKTFPNFFQELFKIFNFTNN